MIDDLKQRIAIIKQAAQKYLNFKFKELKGKTLSQLGWKFKFNPQLDDSTRGWCDENSNIIYINSSIVFETAFDNTQLVEILLHEMCHAIDVAKRGTSDHDYKYRKTCYSVGKQTGYSGYMIFTDNMDLVARNIGGKR